MLFEVRADEDGDLVLFDIGGKDRTQMRKDHPRWVARFIARDWDHAKRVFDVLAGFDE